MIHSTKPIDDATPLDDISGLKLPTDKVYSLKEIYIAEANNIALATIKYLSAPPSKKLAPFTYEWLSKLHEEMFGHVWEWAGKFRQVELSIGIKAYQVPTALKDLADDIAYWIRIKHLIFMRQPHEYITEQFKSIHSKMEMVVGQEC